MAASKTNSSTSTRRKSSSNSSASNTSKRNKTTIEQEVPTKSVSFGDYFHAFSKTKVFKAILFVLITVAVLGLDLLISWNKYNLFFVLAGFEIFSFSLIWTVRVVLTSNSNKTTPDSNSQPSEDTTLGA